MFIGICAGPTTDIETLDKCIGSAISQFDMPHGMVAVIGYRELIDQSKHMGSFYPYYYDEPRKGWITQKKNLLVNVAHEYGFDKVCLVHDYYEFQPDWVDKILKWWDDNDHIQVVVNPIYTMEGERHSDWLLDQRFVTAMLERQPQLRNLFMQVAPNENDPKYVCGVPYEVQDMTNMQYISGGMITANIEVLQAIPLDESRCWGDEEDIEWSQRLRGARIKIGLCMDTYTKLLKPNKWHLYEMPQEGLNAMRDMFICIPVPEGKKYS